MVNDLNSSIKLVESLIAIANSSKIPEEYEIEMGRKFAVIRALLLELKERRNDLSASKREEACPTQSTTNS